MQSYKNHYKFCDTSFHGSPFSSSSLLPIEFLYVPSRISQRAAIARTEGLEGFLSYNWHVAVSPEQAIGEMKFTG